MKRRISQRYLFRQQDTRIKNVRRHRENASQWGNAGVSIRGRQEIPAENINAGNPEAVERYENYLAARREAYHKKKQEATAPMRDAPQSENRCLIESRR